MRIAARKEEHRRRHLRSALEVVQDVVGPNEWVDLAHARQEDHVMRLSLDGGTDPEHNVGSRVEHTLQEVLDLGFLAVGLDFEDPLKDAAFFEDFERDVIKAEI